MPMPLRYIRPHETISEFEAIIGNRELRHKLNEIAAAAFMASNITVEAPLYIEYRDGVGIHIKLRQTGTGVDDTGGSGSSADSTSAASSAQPSESGSDVQDSSAGGISSGSPGSFDDLRCQFEYHCSYDCNAQAWGPVVLVSVSCANANGMEGETGLWVYSFSEGDPCLAKYIVVGDECDPLDTNGCVTIPSPPSPPVLPPDDCCQDEPSSAAASSAGASEAASSGAAASSEPELFCLYHYTATWENGSWATVSPAGAAECVEYDDTLPTSWTAVDGEPCQMEVYLWGSSCLDAVKDCATSWPPHPSLPANPPDGCIPSSAGDGSAGDSGGDSAAASSGGDASSGASDSGSSAGPNLCLYHYVATWENGSWSTVAVGKPPLCIPMDPQFPTDWTPMPDEPCQMEVYVWQDSGCTEDGDCTAYPAWPALPDAPPDGCIPSSSGDGSGSSGAPVRCLFTWYADVTCEPAEFVVYKGSRQCIPYDPVTYNESCEDNEFACAEGWHRYSNGTPICNYVKYQWGPECDDPDADCDWPDDPTITDDGVLRQLCCIQNPGSDDSDASVSSNSVAPTTFCVYRYVSTYDCVLATWSAATLSETRCAIIAQDGSIEQLLGADAPIGAIATNVWLSHENDPSNDPATYLNPCARAYYRVGPESDCSELGLCNDADPLGPPASPVGEPAGCCDESSSSASSSAPSSSESSSSSANSCLFGWTSTYDCDTQTWSAPAQMAAGCDPYDDQVTVDQWVSSGACSKMYLTWGEACNEAGDCVWPDAPDAPTGPPNDWCCPSSSQQSSSSAPSSSQSSSAEPAPCTCPDGLADEYTIEYDWESGACNGSTTHHGPCTLYRTSGCNWEGFCNPVGSLMRLELDTVECRWRVYYQTSGTVEPTSSKYVGSSPIGSYTPDQDCAGGGGNGQFTNLTIS